MSHMDIIIICLSSLLALLLICTTYVFIKLRDDWRSKIISEIKTNFTIIYTDLFTEVDNTKAMEEAAREINRLLKSL